ncbi:MAG: 4-(cytidine 5'-diphospho)-2-C-methyl-D-erythritol kinase [Desulfovibrio sp.]|nr:4-(cytidine 5'-diphospho)-2-C-methyl-D-erythritol kinase [Desulfovibrio sp.]
MTEIRSGCKINLNLFVGHREADGYHAIESLVAPLPEPGDVLKIRRESSGGLRLECDASLDGKNILEKAYEAFAEAIGSVPGVAVRLEKNIPAGAGLGGGSGDAARFLDWLNAASGNPLDAGAMRKLAFSIGSDVPLFLENRPCLIRGKGEIVEPAPLKWKNVYVVIVWPDLKISSEWAYSALDASREKDLTNKAAWNNNLALSGGEGGFFREPFRNDLEDPVFEAYPRLADLKENLYVLKAFYAAMSGSGSAIYGLFMDRQLAETARDALLRQYRHVYLTRYTGM